MSLLRLILLVGLAAGTLILARSNWQMMSVVFLGLRSPALPLAVWIFGAVLAGIATTLVLRALLQLTGLAAQRTERQRFRNQPPPRPTSEYAYTSAQPNPSAPRTWQPPQSSAPQSSYRPPAADQDDWEQDSDDWFEDEPVDSRRDRPDLRQSPSYSSRPDSRSPDRPNSGDPVVDADYRVIVPPQRNLEDEP